MQRSLNYYSLSLTAFMAGFLAPGIFANDTILTLESTNAFVTSLNLSSDVETHVTSALSKLNLTDEGWTQEKRIYASCTLANLALGGNVLLEEPDIIGAVNESWSQTCWQMPNCVAKPQGASQVSTVMRIVSFFQVPFAVRSGGHSPNPGWASLETGILIDLSNMYGMSINADRKAFAVGPGARWGEVYEYLDVYNVTVVGGRLPVVGVGGLMLGGGLSYWTGEFGLSADNVLDFEAVLADGAIINANAQHNNDLFWALKGRGSNFGIVTKFELRTIPIKNVWYQTNVYSVDQAPELLDAFATYQSVSDDGGTVALIISLTAITVNFIYSRPAERPEVFASFYSIPPVSNPVSSRNGTVQTLSVLSGGIAGSSAPRHDYRSANSKVDGQLYKDVYEIWKERATTVNAATGANMTFVMQHIPKNVVDVGNANGGNPLGLESVPQLWWTTVIDWVDPQDDETVRGPAMATTETWAELSAARTLSIPFIYLNYASRDQDAFATYPAANIDRLKAVAAEHDPHRIFQTLQNGGPLLSKVGA